MISTSVDRLELDGFPRVDRYFPQCRIAAFEAASRYLFGIDHFGKCYGWHSFIYERPDGELRFRENGVELDLYLHRLEAAELELEPKVESLFGITSREIGFTDYDAYVEHGLSCLRGGKPVVTQFDLKHIRARREYGKVAAPHVIVLVGFDAAAREFLAEEQMLGRIVIDQNDMLAWARELLDRPEPLLVWELSRASGDERELDRTEVLAQIDANLENLESSSPKLGLHALERFNAEIGQYLASPAFPKTPFSVPGLWVFSHERHLQRKWLRASSAVFPPCAADALTELDALLAKLFEAWLGTDYLLEKCLAAESARALRSLPKYLDAVLALEQAALKAWKALRRQLAAHT